MHTINIYSHSSCWYIEYNIEQRDWIKRKFQTSDEIMLDIVIRICKGVVNMGEKMGGGGVKLKRQIFIELAHWADLIIELRCPYVCMSVPFPCDFLAWS